MSAGVVGAYAPLFHQLFADPRPRRTLIGMGCAAAAGVAAMMLFSHLVVRRPALGAFVCCLAVMGLAVMWCALFAASAVRQNHPANACLVPQLRRRLIVCCVALSAASSVAVAGVVGVFFGYFGYALAAAGLILPFMLLIQRFVSLTFLPPVLFLFNLSLQGPWVDRLADWLLRQPELAVALVGVAIDAALLALALRAALPQGGDRHFAWQQRQWQVRNAAENGASAGASQPSWTWLPGFARPAPGAGKTSANGVLDMLRVLGPTVSEYSQVVSVVAFALVAAAMVLAGVDFKIGRLVMVTSILRMSIVLSVQFYVKALLSAMAARIGEQQLYRLAPASPAAADFNRGFARMALRRFAKVWLVTVAALLVIDWANTGSPLPSKATLVLAAAVLFFARQPLRDYARWRPAPPDWRTVVGGFAAMLAVLGGAAFIDKHPGLPWWTLAAALAAVAVALVCARWREMVRMPPAFPACRMADCG